MERADLVVGGERERQHGLPERGHGTRDEAGQRQQLVGGGETELLGAERHAGELGRQLARGGNDEEVEAVIGLDDQSFGPAFERLAAFARGVLGREGGRVFNVSERNPPRR